MKKYISLIFAFAVLISCEEGWMGEQSKPKGRGEPGEIVLVLDSAKWAGEIGSEFRQIFRESVDGLPRDEPMFDLRQVTPFEFKGILKQAKNLILVVPLNDGAGESRRMRNFFTRDALDSIRNNQNIFMISKKNLFATDQHVLFLVSQGNQYLENQLEENSDYLQAYFNRIEERRAYRRIYDAPGANMIINKLEDKYNFTIKVPYNWKIAEEADNFVWLRLPGQQIDKNIFVAFKPYESEAQFEDENIIEWRNEITEEYIHGDPDRAGTYVITEPLIPPTIREVNLNGKYAKKIIGRWKTKNVTMGGPFVAYVFVDESVNRLYYIDGFVFSPGVKQREIVRELNVILKTFDSKGEGSSS